MSPRYTASHAQIPQNPKGGPPALKRFTLVAATTVAAAGIGAVAASAGSATAFSNLAMEGHATSGSTVGHTVAAAFDAASHPGSATKAAASTPARLRGLQLIAPPARQGAASVTATAAAHTTVASNNAPAAAKPAPVAAKPAPAQPAAAPAQPAAAKPAPAPAPAKPAQAPAKPAAAPAKPGRAKHAAAKPAPAPPKQQPYLIYDSVSPGSIPSHQAVATYANGSYAASPSAVAGRSHVLWIDTNGSDPNAIALDVEPGDATPAGAAAWVFTKMRINHGYTAIVYTMISDWQQVKDAVSTLPGWMQPHVRYWIADPTGVPHVVPGSNATQWYWGKNYDITTANPGFEH